MRSQVKPFLPGMVALPEQIMDVMAFEHGFGQDLGDIEVDFTAAAIKRGELALPE